MIIFDLPISSIYEAFAKARKSRQSALTIFKNDEKLRSFVEDILRLSSVARNHDLISFFEIFTNEFEWGTRLIKSRHPLSSLASYDAFLNEIKKFAEMDRSHGLKDFWNI